MPARTAVAILVSLLVCAAVQGQSCPTAPPPPNINITSSCVSTQPSLCDPGIPIEFRILQPLQSCDVVHWSFGDGTSATSTANETVTHAYPAAAIFTVRADVTNALGTHFGSYNIAVARGYFYLDDRTFVANESEGTARVTIWRSSRAGNATVRLNVIDGSAKNGVHYFSEPSIVVPFTAGENNRTVLIPLRNNSTFANDTSFRVELSSPTGLYLLDPNSTALHATVNILDDEAPALAFALREITVDEDDGTVTLLVTRSGDKARTSTAEFDVTSTLGELTPAAGTISFAPGETSKNLVLNLINDGINSGDRIATVRLRNPSRPTVFPNRVASVSVRVNIIEDDRPPSPIVHNSAVFEGPNATTLLPFVISMPPGLGSTVTVRVRTVADAEAEEIRDFAALDTTISFAPGEAPKTVHVTVFGDRTYEPDESFRLLVEPNAGSGLANTAVRGTIRNDDARFEPTVVHVPRGSVVSAKLVFGPLDDSESVRLTTSDPAIATTPSSVPFDPERGVVEIDVFGVSAGVTNIRAAFPNAVGGAIANLLVRVYEVAAIHFESDTVTAPAGTPALAHLIMTPAPGVPVTATVSSSDESVARVSNVVVIAPDGTATIPITTIADGSAIISVTLPDLYGSTFATVEVVVGDPPPPSRRRSVRK